MLFSKEKTSDTAEVGWMRTITLVAADQCGSSDALAWHHERGQTSCEMSVVLAK